MPSHQVHFGMGRDELSNTGGMMVHEIARKPAWGKIYAGVVGQLPDFKTKFYAMHPE